MKEEFIAGEDFNLYDVKLMEKMYNTRFSGVPLSFTLLDLRKTNGHCHEASDMLVLLLDGSNRVTGNMPNIIGEDKRHSWVECDDFCYDPTEGIKWKKDVYYATNNPTDIVVHPREESLAKMLPHLKKQESPKEFLVALIRDLEDNVFGQLYRPFLRYYIEMFKTEKGLDIKDYDEKIVQQYLKKIQRFYSEDQKSNSKTANAPEDGEPGNR